MAYGNAPFYVDVVLWLMYGLLFLGVVLTVWSALHGLRMRRGQGDSSHGVPVKRVSLGVAALVVVVLAGALALGSTQPLMSNGRPFTDVFWLRVSDMFILSSGLLLLVAVVAAAFGAVWPHRSSGRRAKNKQGGG